MKIKNVALTGIMGLAFGGATMMNTAQSASAHTWRSGTPKAIRGYWRTRQVWIPAYQFSTHAAFKAKAHSVTFAYTQAAPFHLTGTSWRKSGSHSYTVHGQWPGDYYQEHRLTVKKLSRHLIRVYIDGSSATRATPFPNLLYKA